MQKVKFTNKDTAGFYSTLRNRVDQYFITNNISKFANGDMYLKTIIILGGVVGSYILIMSNILTPLGMLGAAMMLGVFKALTGFNVCHDAIHGSYSSNKMVNHLLSYTFYILGANVYIWSITHNQVHHTYTNIPGHDEDIEVAPGIIRLSPLDKINKFQKYQHIYGFLVYGLASLFWVFRKDYKKFFQKTIGDSWDNTKHPTIEYFNLFFFKFLYYFIFIGIPLYFLPITIGQFALGFLMMHLAQGLVLGLVFQLAHVVEGTAFPEVDKNGNIDEVWAIHQMYTTADFSRKSPIAAFLCGGLNMQIEHHLFPKVCHIHYPALSSIVKSTAEEFHIPYIENKTFFQALGSHYRMLKKFGYDEFK
jgi:linoleoyl-CoA desaturase